MYVPTLVETTVLRLAPLYVGEFLLLLHPKASGRCSLVVGLSARGPPHPRTLFVSIIFSLRN